MHPPSPEDGAVVFGAVTSAVCVAVCYSLTTLLGRGGILLFFPPIVKLRPGRNISQRKNKRREEAYLAELTRDASSTASTSLMAPSFISAWIRNLVMTFSSSSASSSNSLAFHTLLHHAIALRLNINPILLRDTSLVRRPFLFTTHPVNFMFPFDDLGFLRVTWLGGRSIRTRARGVRVAQVWCWPF
jgi:hypothetical protein